MLKSYSFDQLQRTGIGLLLTATVVVGISVAAEGQLARATNGLGGLLWFASAGLLVLAALRTRPVRSLWLVAVALTLIVAFVAKPTDMVMATLGLGISGFVIAAFAGRNEFLWSSLIPALYLPAHIGTAVIKAVGRSVLGMESSIRSDPPPVAVVVPMMMVIAALVGGFIAMKVRESRVNPAR